jgi:hypothetical protein
MRRSQSRRKFVTGVLGVDLPDEVLPLSNTRAIVAPFMLPPGRISALT